MVQLSENQLASTYISSEEQSSIVSRSRARVFLEPQSSFLRSVLLRPHYAEICKERISSSSFPESARICPCKGAWKRACSRLRSHVGLEPPKLHLLQFEATHIHERRLSPASGCVRSPVTGHYTSDLLLRTASQTALCSMLATN